MSVHITNLSEEESLVKACHVGMQQLITARRQYRSAVTPYISDALGEAISAVSRAIDALESGAGDPW